MRAEKLLGTLTLDGIAPERPAAHGIAPALGGPIPRPF